MSWARRARVPGILRTPGSPGTGHTRWSRNKTASASVYGAEHWCQAGWAPVGVDSRACWGQVWPGKAHNIHDLRPLQPGSEYVRVMRLIGWSHLAETLRKCGEPKPDESDFVQQHVASFKSGDLLAR
jgi:hypothetical protein